MSQENEQAPSALAGMTSNAEAAREVYNKWAQNYEADVQKWGYDMPTQVANVLSKHMKNNDSGEAAMKILDAGAGDGLSGVALREAFPKCNIVGADLSADMLKVAKERGCYDTLHEMDLNQSPFAPSFEANTFHAVTCVGTMTYVDPTKGTLAEFIRIVKPGGFICYTNRTDKMDQFKEVEQQLEVDKQWAVVEKLGPLPYLPNHPEFADQIKVVIYLYQRTV